MKKIVLSSLLFILVSFFFSGLQASLYFFPISMPMFWMIVTAYYSFRKPLLYSLVLNIAHCLVILSFSALSPAKLLLSMNVLTLAFYFFKERFHTGLTHISLAAGVSTFLYLTSQWFLQILQSNLYIPPVTSWTGISLMTFLFGYPMAYFMEKFDAKIQFERVDTLENLRI